MGKLPRPARVLDQTYTVEPPQDGERFVELRRVGQGQNVDHCVPRPSPQGIRMPRPCRCCPAS